MGTLIIGMTQGEADVVMKAVRHYIAFLKSQPASPERDREALSLYSFLMKVSPQIDVLAEQERQARDE